MFKVVSFDMDGTLTYKTTCLQFFIKKLGQEEKANELERQYKTHEIDDSVIATSYADMLKGLSLKQLNTWIDEIPKMNNIGDAVKALKTAGLVTGITSVGPLFAAEYFQKQFGFDFISGSKHEFINGIHNGKMLNVLAGKDKLVILENFCKKGAVEMQQVVAVGDSRSDVPIFEKAGYRIALNADDNLKDITDFFIHTDDLMAVVNKILTV